MGAWGRGPFDNDAASDWLARAQELPGEAVRAALAQAPTAGHLDVDEGSEALAAATLVAASHDGVTKGVPKAGRPIVAALKATAPLRAAAVRAIDAVLGADSELRALQEEGPGGAAWRRDVEALRARLGGGARPAPKKPAPRPPKLTDEQLGAAAQRAPQAFLDGIMAACMPAAEALARELAKKPPEPKRRRSTGPQRGDVFEVPLSGGRYGYCQYRGGAKLVFFAIGSERSLAIDTITSSPVAFRMDCMRDGIRAKRWRHVAHAPLAPGVAAFVPDWRTCVGGDVFVSDESQHGEHRATPDEIRGLERGGMIWPDEKAVERLELFLRGEPCPWIEIG